MENEPFDIHIDQLFVGLTREPTLLGIPYFAFIIEMMSTVLIFLGTGNPFVLLVGVPIHGITYLISAGNPGVFASMFLWLKTNGRCRNTRFWNGAASLSPLRIQRWQNF
jgi:type IV secretion system protein VirB3